MNLPPLPLSLLPPHLYSNQPPALHNISQFLVFTTLDVNIFFMYLNVSWPLLFSSFLFHFAVIYYHTFEIGYTGCTITVVEVSEQIE